jgi:hypothetical protein
MACYGGVERFNETETFDFGAATPLDLDVYQDNGDRIRSWWQVLAELRRGNSAIQGPAPLDVPVCREPRVGLRPGRGAT